MVEGMINTSRITHYFSRARLVKEFALAFSPVITHS
jgi:hypothetical protein